MYTETPPTQPRRERKRNTAIMLSAITCLFMGIMGYEMIRYEPLSATVSPVSTETSLVAKPKIFLEKAESQQTNELPIRVLSSQNRLQAQKIKALKADLDLVTQRLHDFHLSIQSATKAVESKKVHELETELSQNKQANEHLQDSIHHLHEEIELMDQKSMTMEQTIDSLLSMMDSHKLKQERSNEGFSKK